MHKRLFLIVSLFTTLFLLCTLGEASAVGYDLTLDGTVLYLTKVEATKAAENWEDNAHVAKFISILAAWIPNNFYRAASSTAAGLTTIKYGRIARNLSRCSNRGARITIPWPISAGGALRCFACMKVESR